MNILEIIENKKNSIELTKQEIEYFINGVCDDTIKDYQSASLLMAICINGMTEQETAYLTLAMANSGERIDYAKLGLHNTLDKHSTGGVGDTTTLILIPSLMALGYKIGKMSGRGLGLTGGTLDKLESIKGFDVNIGLDRFAGQVKSIGGAIIGQGLELCPADKKLYALRDATATIDSIPLIASSIMSKKIAGGAENIVIDIKCGKGAFMKTRERAIELGNAMVAIGELAKVNVSYILTNMEAPLGDYIGNSLEIFGAIEVLSGVQNRLYRVVIALGDKLLESIGEVGGGEKIAKVIASGEAKSKFAELIKAQGGDPDVIDNPYSLLMANCRIDVYAQSSGYIQEIDADAIARIVFAMGGGRLTKDTVIDPLVGARLYKAVGDEVKEGEPLAQLFYNNYNDVIQAEPLLKAIKIGKQPAKYELIL